MLHFTGIKGCGVYAVLSMGTGKGVQPHIGTAKCGLIWTLGMVPRRIWTLERVPGLMWTL